jgi:hypothetical protein
MLVLSLQGAAICSEGLERSYPTGGMTAESGLSLFCRGDATSRRVRKEHDADPRCTNLILARAREWVGALYVRYQVSALSVKIAMRPVRILPSLLRRLPNSFR